MEKPPKARIERLVTKLQDGDELTLTDRLIALYFIRQSEGWPPIDPSEAAQWDAAIDSYIAAKRD